MTTKWFYDVFISYRHKPLDRCWAKLLFEALETYRIPAQFSATGITAPLGRCFRDEEELPTSSNLSDDIERALMASRLLIVICSPDTPSSLWVCREIEAFIEAGRADCIFALLIDGDTTTSLPAPLAALFKKECPGGEHPRCLDARRAQRKTRRLHMHLLLAPAIAILAETDPEKVRRFEKKRKNAGLIRFTLAVFLSAAVLLAGGFLLWDFFRVKTAFFSGIAHSFSVPQGIGPLKTIPEHGKAYRFEFSRGRLQRIRITDSAGAEYADEYGISERIFTILFSGRISQMIARGVSNQVLAVYSYSEQARVLDIRSMDGMAISHGWDRPSARLGTLREADFLPYRVLLFYDTEGRITKELYYRDPFNNPGYDEGGFAGKLFEYNTQGQIIQWLGTDENSAVKPDPRPAAGEKTVYDMHGRMTERSFITSEGKPVFHPFAGYASVRFTLAENGAVLNTTYYNAQGKIIQK